MFEEDVGWYSYRKLQHIHLVKTFNKKTNLITYDENFSSNIFYFDKKLRKYRAIPLSDKIKECLVNKSFNEIQKIIIEICFNEHLITKEEYEYNKNLLTVDEL